MFRIATVIVLGVTALSAQGAVDLDRHLLSRYRPDQRAFSFAAIGDQQYGPEGERKWPALVEAINRDARRLAFVLHVGDIKDGQSLCSDEMFASRLESFNAFRLPFVLTPGDNEWTDCHRPTSGSFDAIERLDHLRGVFFRTTESLGARRMVLTRQSEDPRFATYRENAMWTRGPLVFATVHIVGSNNNLGRDAANDREYEARNRANLEWIRTTFRLARDGRFGGVVLAFQANLRIGAPAADDSPASGFADTIALLEHETAAFGRPVLAVHGDTHSFRFDKPLKGRASGRTIEHFFRLEVPGEDDVHWVRVDVAPASRHSPFRITHEDVPANYDAHE